VYRYLRNRRRPTIERTHNETNLLFLPLEDRILQRHSGADGVAERRELVGDGRQHGLGVLDGLLAEVLQSDLALMEGAAPHLPLVLELLDKLIVTPPDSGGEVAQTAELAAGLQTEIAQRARDHHALHLIKRMRHTLEHLETTESVSASLGLVGDHATHSAPENARRLPEVERTATRVGVRSLRQEQVKFELVAKEGARDVEVLSTNANNFASIEELLGEVRCQSAEQMATAINNNGLLRHQSRCFR